MSTVRAEELKKRARMAIEVLTTGHVELLFDLAEMDFKDHNAEPNQGPGLLGVMDAFVRFRQGFSDLRVTILDMICEGDKVVARLRMHGTNDGVLNGQLATGRKIDVE